jgi:hypothetical protein
MSDEKKTKLVKTRAPESLLTAIDRAADKEKMKPSKLVRDALYSYPPIKNALK